MTGNRAKKRPVYRTTDHYIDMLERLIRSAGRRVAGEDPDQLARLIRLRAHLDTAIDQAVIGQRHAGITWQSIGEACGTTKQAAIKKWARLEELAG